MPIHEFSHKSPLWEGTTPQLSIVLVTTDRLDCVFRFLSCLSTQSFTDFEVVFVHGPGLTADQIGAFCASFDHLRLVALPSTDHCVCRSRNLGADLVRGSIVTFADDDCAYPPTTLEDAARAFENQALGGLIGCSIGFGEAVPAARAETVPIQRYQLFYNAPTYVQFFRSEILRHVRFDETLGPGNPTPYQCGDETDFALRVHAAGFHLYRCKSLVVHHPCPNLRDLQTIAKTRAYGAGRMRILRKHGLPAWFVGLNILYPLLRLPLECLHMAWRVARYRWAMFTARAYWCSKSGTEPKA